MIKMTVAEAMISIQALGQFGQSKFPFQPAMIIAANKRTLADVGKEYEERRMALVKKYGVEGEDGNIQVMPDKMDVFSKEVTAIQSEEIELDLKTVSYADLKGTKKELEIEPNVLEPLQWMITMAGQKPTGRKRGGSK